MTDHSDKQRMGTGLKLAAFAAVLAAVFALATLAGGALDPDAATGGSEDSHSEGDMGMTEGHGEHGDAEAPGGLAIAVDGYRLELDRAAFPAGERRDLIFRIVGPDGEVVRGFDEEHEAPLHLIVVRRDLTGYQHLHPEMDAAGTWSVPLELPRGGAYRAYADFHAGEHALTLGADLTAAGRFDPVELPAPSPVAATDGYSVELTDGGDDTLDLTVSRDGRPVNDLQPYLGARGHLVAIREGDLAYLHVHPEETEPGDPTVPFHAELPTEGSYRLFFQFRHDGEVHTAEFTREVDE